MVFFGIIRWPIFFGYLAQFFRYVAQIFGYVVLIFRLTILTNYTRTILNTPAKNTSRGITEGIKFMRITQTRVHIVEYPPGWLKIKTLSISSQYSIYAMQSVTKNNNIKTKTLWKLSSSKLSFTVVS